MGSGSSERTVRFRGEIGQGREGTVLVQRKENADEFSRGCALRLERLLRSNSPERVVRRGS